LRAPARTAGSYARTLRQFGQACVPHLDKHVAGVNAWRRCS
jgi:hypothetical protein